MQERDFQDHVSVTLASCELEATLYGQSRATPIDLDLLLEPGLARHVPRVSWVGQGQKRGAGRVKTGASVPAVRVAITCNCVRVPLLMSVLLMPVEAGSRVVEADLGYQHAISSGSLAVPVPKSGVSEGLQEPLSRTVGAICHVTLVT